MSVVEASLLKFDESGREIHVLINLKPESEDGLQQKPEVASDVTSLHMF